MSTTPKANTVSKDLIVSMEYELKVDGEVIDFSEENDPLEFIQGHGHIIPGLEKALEGMQVGESKEVFVIAADAYGEFDPEGYTEVPRQEFPAEIPLEVGIEVSLNSEDGEELSAFIEEITPDVVTLNFNHPLAGKDLSFKIKIIDLREASAEELEHGHIHFDEDTFEDQD